MNGVIPEPGRTAGGADRDADLKRACRAFAVAASVYAAVAFIAITVAGSSATSQRFADWVAMPVQVLALLGSASLARSRWRERQHTGSIWALIAGFCAVAVVATYSWNEWRALGTPPALAPPDYLYFVDYLLLGAAFALIYVRLGGSFRAARTWLEAATIAIALVGTLWVSLLHPTSRGGARSGVDVAYFLSNAVMLAALMAPAALVLIRLPHSPHRPVPLLLICAALAEVIWEIGWLATWAENRNFEGYYYNFGDVICFTLIAWAAALARPGGTVSRDTASPERAAYSFLPVLTGLLAISLVTASVMSEQSAGTWIIAGLVVMIALLLVTRYVAVRRELEDLNRALVLRDADARVTELVRLAADAIVVVDPGGAVSFASPATETVLGVSPTALLGTRAEMLSGPTNATALARFLDRLVSKTGPAAPIELHAPRANGATRVLRIAGANHLGNPLIHGLALTLSDVSEQRALERDVLDVASEERLRLAGDIHDGLGQQLTGIAMMLQSESTRPHRDPERTQAALRDIIGHMASAIGSASHLARGLSPTYVVRGSLSGALTQVATAGTGDITVDVHVDPDFDDQSVNDVSADHLMRIALEAIRNARRHANATCIDVALVCTEHGVELSITDDGVGLAEDAARGGGLGLRLMEYRARMIGADFTVGPNRGGGTRVVVTLPRSEITRASAESPSPSHGSA